MVPGGRRTHGQFHALQRIVKGPAKAFAQPVGLGQRHHFEVLGAALAAGREHRHGLGAQVDDAAKAFALTHRPGDGAAGHFQLAFDLVEDVERVAHFAVHLVDEGDDGCVALAADFDQAAGLRLHTVGRIDHHQRRIHRREHAVGVFREVFVAGRVEQVDDMVAVQHLHHAGGDRDAALLLDFHPVGGGVAAGFAAFDGAGDLDRTREQQQLFRQRGLARVGVGNDGKGAAAPGFGKERSGHAGKAAGQAGGGSENGNPPIIPCPWFAAQCLPAALRSDRVPKPVVAYLAGVISIFGTSMTFSSVVTLTSGVLTSYLGSVTSPDWVFSTSYLGTVTLPSWVFFTSQAVSPAKAKVARQRARVLFMARCSFCKRWKVGNVINKRELASGCYEFSVQDHHKLDLLGKIMKLNPQDIEIKSPSLADLYCFYMQRAGALGVAGVQ